jgi:hypothetical protein
MAESSTHRDTGDDTAVGSYPGSPPSRPRWLRVSGIIALVLVLLVGVMLLAGHGPGRHLGGGHGPDRHTQPAGGHTP